MEPTRPQIKEVLPRSGLVYTEKGNLREVRTADGAAFAPGRRATPFLLAALTPQGPPRAPPNLPVLGRRPTKVLCKPKLMPIRSRHLDRMEQILGMEGSGDGEEAFAAEEGKSA